MSQLKPVFASEVTMNTVFVREGFAKRVIGIKQLKDEPGQPIAIDWESYEGIGRGYITGALTIPPSYVLEVHEDSNSARPTHVRAAYLMEGLSIYLDADNPTIPKNCVLTKVRVIDPDSEQSGCALVEWKADEATGRFSFPYNSFIKVRES